METTIRVYVRTGIVGAWAVFIGVALAVGASRFLRMVHPESGDTAVLSTAGLPLPGIVIEGVWGLYEGGALSVFLGLILVFIGWYQLLRLA